jgi:acetyl esterase
MVSDCGEFYDAPSIMRPPRLSVRTERAITRALLGLPTPLLRRIVGPPRRSPEGYVLDLQTQGLLWLMQKAGQPDLADGGVQAARRRFEHSAPTLDFQGIGDVDVYERAVPGAAGPRRARVYTPMGVRGTPAPGLLFFHGGGFVIGSLDSHDGPCRALAHMAKVVVVSVDYRLAPEDPFPAAVEDAVAAARWVLENASAVGVDPTAVALGGDSAGGNLAAVAALMLRGASRQPAFQLLIYPATDMTRSQASHRHFADGLMLTRRATDWFMENYLPSSDLARDFRASPSFAADLSGLPPALVVCAGFDPLRDEGRVYAERMRASGVQVEYVCAEGLIHGFLHTAGVLQESARILTLITRRLASALSSRRTVASAA